MLNKIKSLSKKQLYFGVAGLFGLVLLSISFVYDSNDITTDEPIKVGEVYIIQTERYQLSDNQYQHNHFVRVLGYDDDFNSSNNPTFNIIYNSGSIYPNLLNLSMCEVWVYPDQTIEFRSMKESTSFGYTTYSEVGRIHFDNLFWYDNWDDTLDNLRG